MYKIFRFFLFSCLFIIFIFALLLIWKVINGDGFAVGSAILAILSAIFGYLAIQPPEYPGTPEQYISIIDEKVHGKLHASEKEKEEIEAFLARSKYFC